MFRTCCDTPAGPMYDHLPGCKKGVPSAEDRQREMERHNRETIPGYK